MKLMEEQTSSEQQALATQQKKMRGDDVISVLLDEIIFHIFSFLSVKEAYKARLLCREWRYIRIPVLNLELNAENILNFKFDGDEDSCYVGDESNSVRKMDREMKFVRKMNQYLNTFPGKKLVSFSVTFQFHLWRDEYASNLDNWIRFAVRMEAERINFNVHYPCSCYDIHCTSGYDFPCHLLPLAGVSHLKSLCLQRCRLSLPDLELAANQFSSLKSLELVDVMLNEEDVNAIISVGINLESLIIRKCIYSVVKTIRLENHHVPKLKFFSFEDFLEEKVNAVGFERFKYRCMGDLNHSRHPPKAKFILWCFNPDEMPNESDNLPFEYGSDRTLFWLKDPVAPALPASMSAFAFGGVKNLQLVVSLTSEFDILAVTCILDAFPVLERFDLSVLHEPSSIDKIKKRKYSNRQYPHQKEVKITGFPHLKEVEINGFQENVVPLAIHILNNAVALEKIFIYGKSKQYADAKLMSRDDVYGFLLKEKANPKTQIFIL